MDILCKVGGLDIAAMTGFYLGCAAAQVPVILDGAISAAAALLAVRLCPNAEKALLPSHWPSEPCGQALLAALGLEPVLHGSFHLGEGTGAVALMPLLDMAQSVYRDMSTFGGMGIGAYRPDGEQVPRQSGAGGRTMTALVFGGAASGKSEYGEKLVCSLPRTGELIYLATMEPFGPEAESRIRRHRELRAGRGFSTLERARELAGCPLPSGGTVLLEDLGNLAANELFSGTDMDPEGAFLRIRDGLQAVRDRSEHLVVISERPPPGPGRPIPGRRNVIWT